MSFKILKSLLFLLILISLQKGIAIEDLDLRQTLNEVNQNSLILQESKEQLNEQSYNRVEATSAFLPMVSGNINYLTHKRYMLLDVNLGSGTTTIPQIVPTTQYTLSVRWNVFDGFASTYRLLSANQNLKATQDEFDWTQFQLQRNSILAFYKLLAAQEVKLVFIDNLQSLKDHLRETESSKRVGIATQYDLLRTQVQVSEAEAELINAEDNIHTAYEKLAEILGKEKEERAIKGQFPALRAELIQDLNQFNSANRKDLMAMQKKSEAAHYAYQSANKYWFPKISLFGDYQYYNNRTDGFNDEPAFREGYLFGINLSWNLFDGFSSYAKSGESESHSLRLEKTLQINQLKAKNDLGFWKRKYLYYCSVYNAKSSDIARSTEALRLAKAGRKVGIRTNTDILDAQSDLNRSKIARINSQIGTIEALINLELSSGQKLYSFEN